MKKTLSTILLFIVFGYTSQGWVLGIQAGATGLVYSEWGECRKWEGEERPCSFSDRALMVSLSKLLLR